MRLHRTLPAQAGRAAKPTAAPLRHYSIRRKSIRPNGVGWGDRRHECNYCAVSVCAPVGHSSRFFPIKLRYCSAAVCVHGIYTHGTHARQLLHSGGRRLDGDGDGVGVLLGLSDGRVCVCVCVLANRPHKSMPFARSVIMLCAHTLTHTNTHIRACACVIWPDGPNTRERTYGRTHAHTHAHSHGPSRIRCVVF